MKYLLELNECAEMLGFYDSIEQAKLVAENMAREHGEPMRAKIWDTRQATPEDRDLFEHSDDVDVDAPLWWESCRVPENIAEEFTTALQIA